MHRVFLVVSSSLLTCISPIVAYHLVPQVSRKHVGITSHSPLNLLLSGPLWDQVDEDIEMPSSKQKVRTMASFLVTKLLEQAMLEAAKDKSKMSEADALALLDTLQKMSATKTAQEENSSSSWQAADDATRGQSSGKNELDDVDLLMQVAGEDIAKTPLATESPQNEVLVVVEENPVIMAKDKNIEKGMQVVTTASAPLQENPPVLPGKMMKVMDLKVPAVVSPTDLPPVVDDFTATTTMPRIPDVISKDFGKPLEVMAYDVPALRDSSSPYKSVQCDEVNVENNQMENVQATVEQSSTVTWNIKPAEIPKENPIQYSDDLPKETYDKLPDEEINLVQDQSEPLVSLMSNSEIIEENSTAVSGNILMDREDGNGDFSTQEVPTSSLTGDVPEVVELIDIVASNETTTFGIMEEEEEKVLDDGIQKREDQKDYTFSSHETVEESGGIEAIPVKLLAASELEESSSTSESSLPVDGEKYKDMSLEDKAFAILSDLGMLQKDNLSVASPTIEQKVVDFEESMMDVLSSDQSYANLKEATMPDVDILLESEADKCDDKLPADGVPGTTGQSLQERVVRPIRSFLSQPRSEPLFSRETEMTPTDLILDVRKQPKSPEVEAQLASKYTQIEDLGDRAFTILKDLGMVGN